MPLRSVKHKLPDKEEVRSVLKEFREFAIRGNVVDMTVGIVVGTAFTKLVSSLVENLVMPPVGLFLGRMDFSNFFISLDGKHYATLSEATEKGAPVLKYGLFINQMLDFLILAFVIFLVVRQINRIRRRGEEAAEAAPPEPTEKSCDYCLSTIPIKATRCPHCTSHLADASVQRTAEAND